VINLSLGESGIVGRLRAGGALNDAIGDASALGAVVVAASGNDGTPRVRNYQITVPVIVVGATAPGGQPAEFSNFGDLRTVVAPGVGIMSTTPVDPTTIFPAGTDGYDILDGTSMAAPQVSGVAALLIAQGRDADDVARILVETATNPDGDVRLGSGLIDAAAAVATPTSTG
jgi:subtilisin family serine protease